MLVSQPYDFASSCVLGSRGSSETSFFFNSEVFSSQEDLFNSYVQQNHRYNTLCHLLQNQQVEEQMVMAHHDVMKSHMDKWSEFVKKIKDNIVSCSGIKERKRACDFSQRIPFMFDDLSSAFSIMICSLSLNCSTGNRNDKPQTWY